MTVYETVDKGYADTRSYCYACPYPIEVGDVWRRERFMEDGEFLTRDVHNICPVADSAMIQDIAKIIWDHRGTATEFCATCRWVVPDRDENDALPDEQVWTREHQATHIALYFERMKRRGK